MVAGEQVQPVRRSLVTHRFKSHTDSSRNWLPVLLRVGLPGYGLPRAAADGVRQGAISGMSRPRLAEANLTDEDMNSKRP